MAISFTLVSSSPNQLRYLCTQDGGAGTSTQLPNTAGGGTPNFQTDAGLFPLREFPLAGFNGFGPLPAGTFTVAQIRAMLLADDPASAVLTNNIVARCKAFITPREGNFEWAVDALPAATSPGGRSDPTYVVTTAAVTAGTAYLDIVFQNTPDR